METKPVAANASWMFSATFDEVVDFIRYVFIIYMYVGKRLFTGGFYKARYTFFYTMLFHNTESIHWIGWVILESCVMEEHYQCNKTCCCDKQVCCLFE